MSNAIRITRTLILAVVLAAPALFAQESATNTAATSSTAVTTSAASQDVDGTNSNELRNQFNQVLRERPPQVAKILALEPTLLSNGAFLSGYPEIARFVELHPEIRQNPAFYLEDFETRSTPRSAMNDILDMIAPAFVMVLLVIAFSWLIRTIVEQRRWTRLSRTQSEVHNKILDRFGNTDELLAYMKTPAGTKFLESAPIPLHSEAPAQHAPLSRVIWSIQIGVIIAAAAIGMLIVSGRLDKESATAMFSMGVIALCVGGGFVISAVVSLLLSRRLGLWQAPIDDSATLTDAGFVK